MTERPIYLQLSAAAIAELKSCLATQWYRAESWQLLSEVLSKEGQATEPVEAKAHAERYEVHLHARPAVP